MLTRRRMLLGLGTAVYGTACSRSRPKPIDWPRTTHHAGIEFIELFPHDADESSPLVVVIHGMGDRPEAWVDGWRSFPRKTQIAIPRAFDPRGRGFSWFEFKDGMTDAEFGAAVGAAEARLWAGIADLAGQRRVIVTGFSQGGILSFALASRHPDVVSHAFPVAGSCPGPLLPKNKAHTAPILAFHGTADPVLDIKWDREAVAAFKAEGNDASLQEYDGVGHTMTPRIRTDLWDAIGKVLPPG